MRIALITHQWPGARLGGIGVYTRNCARALVEAGHEAHVFTLTLPKDVRRAAPAGIVLHEVPDFAERIAAGTIPSMMAAGVQAAGEAVYRLAIGAILCDAVRAAHGDTPFDILEGPEYEGMMLPLVMQSLSGAVRTVVHLHSGSAIAHEAMRTPESSVPSSDILAEAIEFASVLAADAVCAPSRQLAMDTLRHCDIADVTVLPLPFFPDGGSFLSSGRGKDAVLFVGRLEMVKGAHLIPKAANLFLSRYPEAHLRLAGPDSSITPDAHVASMSEWIRSRLDAAVADRVHFLGERDQSQLAMEYRRAAFLIVPSFFDSYSYVCCEALAAGLPVIVSDDTGAAEVVSEAGVVFERGNARELARAMIALWSDDQLRQKFSSLASARAAKALLAGSGIQQRIAFYERCRARGRRSGGINEALSDLTPRYIGPLLGALGTMTGFVAGIRESGARTPGMRLRHILDGISAETGKPTEVILFGAGRFTSRLLAEAHVWESAGHRVVGLIDDHPRFLDSPRHLGLPVESLAMFYARLPMTPAPVVVLGTDTFQEEFWGKTAGLRECGARVFRLNSKSVGDDTRPAGPALHGELRV